MGACASSLTRWRLWEGFRALLTSEWLAGGWKALHKCTMILLAIFHICFWRIIFVKCSKWLFQLQLYLDLQSSKEPNNRKLHFELEHLVAVVMDSKQISHS